MNRLRLGLLSTARINEWSVLQVIRELSDISLLAVASRNEARANNYGEKHDIPRRYGKYGDLIADPDIDAVYISLPNALHYEWTREALLAGKHVLCEKPLCSDPEQVLEVEEIARKNGLRVVEAMHYRHHPDTLRAIQIIKSDFMGEIEFVDVYFFSNVRERDDIRLNASLSGGALMDIGCYCLDLIRWVTGDDAPKIIEVKAALGGMNVDMSTQVTLLCHRRIRARFHCSLESESFDCGAEIGFGEGSVLLKYPFLPAIKEKSGSKALFSCAISGASGPRPWRYCSGTSYFYQLQNFRDAIQGVTDGSSLMTGSHYNAALLAAIASQITQPANRKPN
jgi:predicted dehydrogenase